MDLIDRQAAIKMCREPRMRNADCSDFEMEIMMLPSIQTERPKGKWIPHSEKSREYIGTVLVSVEYDYWFCNTCGYRVENGQPLYNFCPHCGADMRSGRGERWTKNSLKKDEKY